MAVTEILASVDDVNTHLPTDKIDATEATMEHDVNLYEVDAARFVRSMLAGIFTPLTLVGWDSPAHTPDLIRGVAGRLIAAKYYAVRYAEDSDESKYAQNLYNEALGMITNIRTGTLVVVDVTDTPLVITGVGLASDDFWPNNTSAPPYFTMDKAFF